MRTFISIELPDEIKKNITEMVNTLKESGSSVKWVEAQNLHITLKFLGWVEDKKIDNLIELVSRIMSEIKSFKAKFEEVGTFPEGRKPRVVWVGTTEGKDKLVELAKVLEDTLASAGYRSEEREFKSHITIGRIKEKEGIEKLKEKIEEFKSSKFGEMMVERVSIMKSTLTPKGPIYEILKEVRL